MSKFHGKIGYGSFVETSVGSGIYKDEIVEQTHYGEILKNSRRYSSGETLNDELDISNTLSMVANPYAAQNFHAIKYINWMGVNWKVKNVDVKWPRLILYIGGIYNGQSGSTTSPVDNNSGE